MKKLNLFFAMFLMVTAGFMTSCTDSEITPTVVVTEVGSPSYQTGTEVEYTVEVKTGNKELNTLTVTGATGTISGDDWDAASSKFNAELTSATVTYKFTITEAAGSEFDVTFEVSDDSENVGTEPVAVVVAEAPMKMNTITLGAQTNSVGGAAASFEGSVFTLSESAAQAAIIDILYYNGSKGAAIYAPTQSDIQGISGWNWSSWSVKNATRFVMASDSDFTDATSSSVETLASSASLDVAENLAVGSVVAFTTINDKSGVFKVTSLDDSSTGTITIEVKIQDTVATK